MYLYRLLILAILAGMVLFGCSKKDADDFSRVDYNKDGKIVFEELIVVFPDLTVEEFLAADADHNGSIDEKEYKHFLEMRRAGKKPEAKPQAPAAQSAAPATGGSAAAGNGAVAPHPEATAAPATTAATASGVPAATTPTVTTATPSASDQTPPVTPPAAAGSPDEPVETVAAPAASAQAASAAAPKTYRVERGDNLSRIAKRFGLTVKELMAANGLKAADRVEAGAKLTIPATGTAPASAPAAPASPASPAPAAVTSFLSDFFTKSENGDVNGLLDYYADSVDYYKKGKKGRDIVRQDKVAYFGRWPKRTYKPGAATVAAVAGSAELRVTVPVAYWAARGDKTTSGQAIFTFLLRPEGTTYRIVGEQSVVGKRGEPHR
jgi:LysM repeat protein